MNITIDKFETWDGYYVYWVYQGTPQENINIQPDELCYYLEGAVDLVTDLIIEDVNSVVHCYLDEDDISREEILEAFRDSYSYVEAEGFIDWDNDPPADLVTERVNGCRKFTFG